MLVDKSARGRTPASEVVADSTTARSVEHLILANDVSEQMLWVVRMLVERLDGETVDGEAVDGETLDGETGGADGWVNLLKNQFLARKKGKILP